MFAQSSLAYWFCGALLKPLKKRGQGYAQGGCHLVNVLEAQIALAALNRPHKRPVDAAFVGKGLLRIALVFSQLSDSLTQSFQEQIGMSESVLYLTPLRLHYLHIHCMSGILD